MARLLGCALSVLSSFLLLVASQAVAQQMVSVNADEVNMRSGPGTQHAAEWRLDQGYPLKVIGSQGGWIKVIDFENDTGWILRRLTGSTPHHVVKAKVANMRSAPTTSSRIIAKVTYGDVLRTLERKGGWVKLQKREGGARGWIARGLLWGW